MMSHRRTALTATAVGLLAALLFAAPSGAATAQDCLAPNEDGILWQIGQPDAPVAKAELGALEYPANDTWVEEFQYTAFGIDETPDFPGYLAPDKLSTILEQLGFPPRTPTDAAQTVVIDWVQCKGYNLVIEYGRFGSEADLVELDGDVVEGLSAGGENVDAAVESEPIALPKADHTLTISYSGGGSANGHYIDYLRARLVQCEEPDRPNSVPEGYTFLTADRSPQVLTVDVPEGTWDLVASIGEFNCSLRAGTVEFEGYGSIAAPQVPDEVAIVTETIGTAVGPATLSITISTDDPISVGVRVEAE